MIELEEGKTYEVFHRSEMQKLVRKSVMVYLGRTYLRNDSSEWSARPVAGTQELPDSWIVKINEVHPSTKRCVNVIVRDKFRVL